MRSDITDEEKLVIKWQFQRCGDFETALWGAIIKADENNLARLALGYPQHVRAFQSWAFGKPYSMGEKLRGLGLGI
jgi:hypothetical protein